MFDLPQSASIVSVKSIGRQSFQGQSCLAYQATSLVRCSGCYTSQTTSDRKAADSCRLYQSIVATKWMDARLGFVYHLILTGTKSTLSVVVEGIGCLAEVPMQELAEVPKQALDDACARAYGQHRCACNS